MKTADVILKIQVENELSVRDSSLYLAHYVDTVSCVRRIQILIRKTCNRLLFIAISAICLKYIKTLNIEITRDSAIKISVITSS